MSFLYDVGDKVVVVTWKRGEVDPVEVEILERKSAPAGRLYPYYRVRSRVVRGGTADFTVTEHKVLGLASEFVRPTHRYYQVMCEKPLLTYFRAPLPPPRWPSARKQMIAIMTAVHRVKPMDIFEITSIEGTDDAEQAAFAKRLARAYAGDPSAVPMAALYDWYGDHFTLVRKATESDGG